MLSSFSSTFIISPTRFFTI
uniref:Uncharacterized protein n=1 Tax=Arundo donax TaxID=35708 RepID=A0A0A8ZMK6_ARUDO